METPSRPSDTRTRDLVGRVASIALAVTLVAVLAGCSKSDTETDATSTSTSTTVKDTTTSTPDDTTAAATQPDPGDTAEPAPAPAPAPADPGTPQAPAEPAAPAAPQRSTTSAPKPAQPQTGNGSGGGQPSAGGISMDRAIQIAVGKYGGTVVEVEADSYRGTPTWEVELANSSMGRIEVHVSRTTGEILKVDDENDD